MTKPVLTARGLRIAKVLTKFDWHDFGLDEVSEAEKDWAYALAERIDRDLKNRIEETSR